MPKIKVKGKTVQTGERSQTNGRTQTHTHTHTDATKRIISSAMRSITIEDHHRVVVATLRRSVWMETTCHVRPETSDFLTVRVGVLDVLENDVKPFKNVGMNSAWRKASDRADWNAVVSMTIPLGICQ